MASLCNSESLSTSTSKFLGLVTSADLQREMTDDTNNSFQATDSNAKTIPNDFDNLVLPDMVSLSNERAVENNAASSAPPISPIANSNVQVSDSSSNNVDTSTMTNVGEMLTNNSSAPIPRSSSALAQPQAQACATTTDNQQADVKTQRHIMISYHHDSSLDVCEKIGNLLKDLNYKIWIDKDDLYGGIHEGMARAIENSSVVLICFNRHYCQSYYCIQEVLYTVNKHINFIPCLMEPGFVPEGSVGIAITDQLYVEFSLPSNFDQAFEGLVAGIKNIEARSQTGSAINATGNNSILPTRLNTIVCNSAQLFNMTEDELQALTKDELIKLIVRVSQQQNSTDTPPLSPTNNNNNFQQGDQLLQQLLIQAHSQAEFLANINNTLLTLTDTRTVIKLSLLIMFLWTTLNLSSLNRAFWS